MLRQAAELGEREKEGDDCNDEEQGLPQDEQQDSRAENGGHYQVNQNRQSKIHDCNYKHPPFIRKSLSASWTQMISYWTVRWGKFPNLMQKFYGA